MPANLTPPYFDAEKKYKSAQNDDERIIYLEEMLAVIPKHKGTEKLQAQIKTKISKLRDVVQKKAAATKHGPSYHIDKKGSGQVVIIGPPNTGKSSLIEALTNAHPLIADYPFSTLEPYPAMMEYGMIQIQLIDTPPLTPDYIEVWHSELIKGADAVICLLDKDSDGFNWAQTVEKLNEKHIGFKNEPNQTPPPGILFFKKTLLVVNKKDSPGNKELLPALREFFPGFPIPAISIRNQTGLEELKKQIFQILEIVRVYSKVPGKKAEMESPFTFPKGSTVQDLARHVHKDFAEKLKFARIWGAGKHDGQRVNRDHILDDEDVIELHI